jgi:hypothetical protein
MSSNRWFRATITILCACLWLGGRPALGDEFPKQRSSRKTCEIRRAATLLTLGTLLKQGDHTGAKFLLLGLTGTFADCQGVLQSKPDAPTGAPGSETIASFSTRLINKVLHSWSPDLAIAELDSVRFNTLTHPHYDQRCAYRVAEVAKSFEAWHQTSSTTRVLQASLEHAKQDQSRVVQKELTDQLWDAMGRNDNAAKNYRLQIRACLSACAPIEPADCHPDNKTSP